MIDIKCTSTITLEDIDTVNDVYAQAIAKTIDDEIMQEILIGEFYEAIYGDKK